ncbi:Cof1p [Rhizophagus irregularis DAOM 197198w]|uniref:Cofilin n=1 Tax=Rhizophagus irregularis (strain DAOM 197198w) TaxID=1432141 RepID=A0A015MAP5_RHIIW|nr:Cof1p [Rhizophagus irregularis DAOM 197198w]
MSSSSGVDLSEECLEFFQDLKLKKKYKYILYKLDDSYKSIVLEKAVEEATYDDFVSELTSSGPRYAVYDFDYEKPGEGQRSKIAFYSCFFNIKLKIKTHGFDFRIHGKR